ncbi:S1 family peptidase [Saccharothrix violaceirubra]|uniref:Streptogrisin C n=1 Tax=Saccharothrix violaceirubra TaxID=413306 RepID=A0A7W7SZQ6_9PSEU|nr:S1 family peptidase [Saccharothrix violaceirubra]MBB4963923.1 streptogrisin C [Saccharothrix violaceirubra]
MIALGFSGNSIASAAPDRSVDLPADVLAAMQRDLGLTAEQANTRAAQQEQADKIDDVLKAKLGASFGGAWFDANLGKLVVGVTDAKQAGAVTAAGGQAKVVKYAEAKLDQIVKGLDTQSGRVAGSSRSTNAKPASAAVKGLVSWSVDPTTNQVVVTALDGNRASKAVTGLKKYGDAVRVEYTADAPRPTVDFLDGGDDLNYPAGGCSAGFNMRNNAGQRFVLTAGHCGSAGQVVRGQGNVVIGVVAAAFFPTWDDALISVTNTGYWIQGPWVDVNPPNGGIITVSGYSNSPVGTAICKSGRTTKLTCGVITAKSQTVTYSGGTTVYDLVRHNACVEPGDSGGSNFRNTAVRTAEGVTSGAQLWWVGGQYRCGQVVGQPNVAWYYPAAISIPYYNAVYGAFLW